MSEERDTQLLINVPADTYRYLVRVAVRGGPSPTITARDLLVAAVIERESRERLRGFIAAGGRMPTWPELQYRLTHCDECDCEYEKAVPGCSCECHNPDPETACATGDDGV